MNKLKFFKCKRCGNVIVKVIDSKMPLSCCGETMMELTPNTSDGAGEKHLPVVSIDGKEVSVMVSTVLHPSTPEHHIEFIVLQTCHGYQVKCLNPEDTPKATFMLDDGDKAVAAYEYCNLHGLWKTEIYAQCGQVYF